MEQPWEGTKLAFYPLTDHLYRIAQEVPLMASLLCHNKIVKHVRKEQDEKNRIIFRLWDDHEKGALNTMELWENLVTELKPNLHSECTSFDDGPDGSDPYDMDLHDV